MKKIIKSREFMSLLIIIGVFLGVGLFNAEFLSMKNIFQTLNGSVVYSLVALGMTFVLFIGEIDVSIGATLGFSAALSGSLILQGYSFFTVLLVTITFGLVVGSINAIGVLFFKIPSIIMTLGTNGIIRGLIYVYTGGKWIENLPMDFKNLAQKNIGNTFSYFYAAVLLLAIVLYIITTKTDTGRSFKAVGDNQEGARLIGISVQKIKFISFIICSIFASVAGIMYTSRVGFVTPTAGIGYEMTAIAACVIGGVSLNGGIGSIWAALTGSILMASISRVLVFLGFPSTFDNTITGSILIVIVVVGAIMNQRSDEKIRQARLATRND